LRTSFETKCMSKYYILICKFKVKFQLLELMLRLGFQAEV